MHTSGSKQVQPHECFGFRSLGIRVGVQVLVMPVSHTSDSNSSRSSMGVKGVSQHADFPQDASCRNAILSVS
jgi:hypothetical protein